MGFPIGVREAILGAKVLRKEEIQIDDWGCSVWVRTLSGTERDSFEQAMISRKNGTVDMSNVRARLAVLTICNAEGKRIFRDDDAHELGQTSSRALDQCFEAAQRLNGFRKEDVEDLAKNYGSARNGDSG